VNVSYRWRVLSRKKKAAGKKPPADSGTRSGRCSSKQEERVRCSTAPDVNETVIDPGDGTVDHKGKIVIDATVAKSDHPVSAGLWAFE
jgi:hypothetical protein